MIVETICTWGCSTFGFVEYHLGSYSQAPDDDEWQDQHWRQEPCLMQSGDTLHIQPWFRA